MTVSFEATAETKKLIQRVAERGAGIRAWQTRGFNMIDCEMCLIVCHNCGCPLDFQKLLDAPQADFTHDILGIIGNINRETGKLDNFFDPRCALPEGAQQ